MGSVQKGFNPRTHTGCDVWLAVQLRQRTRFQSTHPHGVRPSFVRPTFWDFCFNPRTHTGCDDIEQVIAAFAKFQSTHPHGVRLFFLCQERYLVNCFNPRTHTGCDNDCRPAYPVPWCFNPRTHTGCDRPPVVLSANPSSFQSTHPHGVRRISSFPAIYQQGFNPRTHTGCDSTMALLSMG